LGGGRARVDLLDLERALGPESSSVAGQLADDRLNP